MVEGLGVVRAAEKVAARAVARAAGREGARVVVREAVETVAAKEEGAKAVET